MRPDPNPTWRELGYYTDAELAKLRRIQTKALSNERSRGEGPPYTTIGRNILYPIDATRAWLAKRITEPGSTPTLATGRRRNARPSSAA